MRKKNTVITIASLLVITLFIGTAMSSATAGSLPHATDEQEVVKEGCSLCASDPERPPDVPSCETCKETVDYVVDYMKDYVKENVDDIYFLWQVDAVLFIFEGLIMGFKESCFNIEIDEDALRANIEYWVNKTVGPQKFTVTLFLVKLGAIAIGVTDYLISLCNDDEQVLPDTIQHSRTVSWVMLRFYKWIRVLRLLGL